MMEGPLVSICIPTYNRAGMVSQAIESALSQSYQNLEVIVVDNASTDNTSEVVMQFTDKRLKFIRNERNLGLFGNFNRCIELAQGQYIHILHSDDTIDPEFTQNCVRFYREYPSVKMTTTSARIIRYNGVKNISISDRDMVLPAPEGLKRLLSERELIVCPSVMVHRDVYRDVGTYSLEYPYSSDLYQWFRITRKYDIGFVSKAWLNYRQGDHSESFRLLFASPSGYLDTLKILVRIVNDLGNERPQFNDELNCAIKRFMGDCLYAAFVRGDTMKGFSPSIFIGIAISSWSLIVPESLRTMLSKVLLLPMMFVAGIAISCGPFRRFVKRYVIRENPGY